MKQITAYVRRSRLNPVVEALEKEGAPGISVVEIHPVGYGYEPDYFGMASPPDVMKSFRFAELMVWSSGLREIRIRDWTGLRVLRPRVWLRWLLRPELLLRVAV